MISSTIFDVAEKAGVSIKSVSRVLNGEPNVSAAMREKVLVACEALQYTPNISARVMAGSKSYFIISLNDHDLTRSNWESERGNNWIDRMLFGAMTACETAGYHFMMELVGRDSPDLERQVLAILGSMRPDGLILTQPNAENDRLIDMLYGRRLPFVRIGSSDDRHGFKVRMDDVSAAYDATDYLIQLGHTRIGLISGSPKFLVSAQREQGYRAALTAAGIAIEPALIQQGDFSFASGERASEALFNLHTPPTAIIASNDEMALAALKTAARRGLRVPDQVSIISFDDGAGVKFSSPPLTSIRQPTAEIAMKAVELLVAAVENQPIAALDHIVPHRLILRESCAPPQGLGDAQTRYRIGQRVNR